MNRRTFLIGILVGAGVVALVLGVRHTRKVSSALEAQAAPAAATAAGGGQGLTPTIRFVKNALPMPEFTATDLSGQTVSPSLWKGKVLLINFWATWCGPCRTEIPDLVALQTAYADRFQIIGISVDTPGSDAQVKQFAQQFRVNYPVVMGDADLQRKFGGVYGIPATFLIDLEGRMVQKHIGLISKDVVESEIRVLLGMSVDAVVEHVEDTGKIFTANATELPGIDLNPLSPELKAVALQRLRAESCTCGCGFHLAECRINDQNCTVSLERAKAVIENVRKGA